MTNKLKSSNGQIENYINIHCLQRNKKKLIYSQLFINNFIMPPMRRMARRTARRTSRRQNAMYNNQPQEEYYEEPAQAPQQPVQQAPQQPAQPDPKQVLADRLANGEITPEEYKAAIAALGY